MSHQLVRVPVIELLDFRRCNVFEHTPVDYYKCGEYPRFVRPIDAQQPRAEWRLREVKGEKP